MTARIAPKIEKLKEYALLDSEYSNTPNTSILTDIYAKINDMLFPGIPSHYPLRKKLIISRTTTSLGASWDIVQIVVPILSCITYVMNTVSTSLSISTSTFDMDVVFTIILTLEMVLNGFIDGTWAHFADFVTIIDILSVLPVYVTFATNSMSFYEATSILQCLRLLRLMRIFKNFKLMRNISGVRRQVIYLTVTLTALTFLAAGVFELFEDRENVGDCKFINFSTGWEPSCHIDAPSDSSCECAERDCVSKYLPEDREGEPTSISCSKLSFFDAFYFIIVTVSTVGYGDVKPSNNDSKLFIIIFIMFSLVYIPMSVSKLQLLLSLKSPFRRPYGGPADETHIIVCGYVNDARKLSTFFGEFFHEDRVTDREYRAVILSSHEPSEEVQMLLADAALGSRVTYVIGTAMATEDLKRVKADSAKCMFFLCNTDVRGGKDSDEDAATILRALSVSNFNPQLETLVQVLRPEERVILKDSDVDCILCLDEFKTAIQARNAVCPGFSTMIENLFQSVEGVEEDSPLSKCMAPWYEEYLHGSGMELYFVDINHAFIRNSQYNFSKMAEIIFAEFGVIALGMCNAARDSVVFNPRLKDLSKYSSMKEFYRSYSSIVIMADDQKQADEVSKACGDEELMRQVTMRLEDEEERWPCNFQVDTKSRVGGKPESDAESESASEGGESDSEVEADSYIGFSSYSKHPARENDNDKSASSKAIHLTLPTTIKGPAFNQVPKVTKGVPLRKTRLLPDAKIMKATVARERENMGPRVPGELGQVSAAVEDAFHLQSHVIVFGCDTYLNMFLSELRRPAVLGDSYHPIVIISENEPAEWDHVAATYNDVYYICAPMSRHTISTKANINKAFSVIILASRDENAQRDDDAVQLFSFLKLEQLIPPHVFCSIELSTTENMAVLNSTIMKRERRLNLEKNIADMRASMRKENDKRLQTMKSSTTSSAKKQRETRTESGNVRRDSVLNPRRTFSTRGNSHAFLERKEEIDKEEKRLEEESAAAHMNEKTLWEQINTHYVYPVYACARVYVPSSFETLLVQSFFVKLTPVICERFVCGQQSQTVQQMSMPPSMAGRKFFDLYRLVCACGAVPVALYRAPRNESGALLPYVFTAPPADTILYKEDKIFIFASNKSISLVHRKAALAQYHIKGVKLYG